MIEIGEIRDVALHGGYVFADFLYGSFQFRLAPAGDEDVGAFGYETLRGGEADAAVAAGDDGYFSFEFAHFPSDTKFVCQLQKACGAPAVLERVVAQSFPALAGWANVCRASGAGLVIGG